MTTDAPMLGWVFQDPWWFAALLALPAIALLRRWRRVSVLVVPFAADWHRPVPVAATSWPAALAYVGCALLVFALARPQSVEEKRETRRQGYDIVLAIDLSGSMLAEDFEIGGRGVNRLQAVKPVLEAFINQRTNDRIGIVVFAGRAYTLAPLTFDHDWLRRQTGRLSVGLLEDGTAIGDAVGVALSRLEQGRKESGGPREGAFVVLLTDGANNAGALDPRETIRLASTRGVKVYTIGAGREGLVTMPVPTADGGVIRRRMMSDLDEVLLREMAEKTGGRFFRAEDSRTIASAFTAIDRAQKSEFEARAMRVTAELFPWFAIPGLACLGLAALLMTARLRTEVVA